MKLRGLTKSIQIVLTSSLLHSATKYQIDSIPKFQGSDGKIATTIFLLYLKSLIFSQVSLYTVECHISLSLLQCFRSKEYRRKIVSETFHCNAFSTRNSRMISCELEELRKLGEMDFGGRGTRRIAPIFQVIIGHTIRIMMINLDKTMASNHS